MTIRKEDKNTMTSRTKIKVKRDMPVVSKADTDEKNMDLIDFYRKEFVALYLENEQLKQQISQLKKENEILKKGVTDDAESIVEIADDYFYGKEVEKSEDDAFTWYCKAAYMGNAYAMCKVADCYETGTGVEKDRKEALYWYTKAAEQGLNVAMFKAGMMCALNEDFEKALYWLKKAEENGYTDARSWLEVLSED